MRSPKLQLRFLPHPRWPLPSSTPSASPPSSLHISVLDSSFNPAHLAHLLLALHPPTAHARLLLLSTKNADKGPPKPGDASWEARVQMMICVAKEMANSEEGANTAVGVVEDEPTFVGKSRVLNEELGALVKRLKGPEESEAPDIRLNFIQGWDTLLRFFSPHYYPPSLMPSSLSTFFLDDRSTVSCARRGSRPVEEETAFLNSDEVKTWYERGVVDMFELKGEEEITGLSSTKVRKLIKEQGSESVVALVPEGVVDVIEKEGLYKS